MLDDALVQKAEKLLDEVEEGLNPCCAGRCSSTDSTLSWILQRLTVLILVVLDDALVLEK